MVELVLVTVPQPRRKCVRPVCCVQLTGVVQGRTACKSRIPRECHSIKCDCHSARKRRKGASSLTRYGSNWRPTRFINEVGEIHEAIESRQDCGVPDVVRVKAELSIMLALDPSHRIGELEATLVYGIEGAKVMPEREVVRNVEIRLPSNTREVVMTA